MKMTLALALIILAARSSSNACCTAGMRGQNINIAQQEIIVAWNPETKIEHFVRRATFRSGDAAKNFGFLVPTPTKPALAEAPDAAFDQLFAAIQPEVRTEVVTDYYFSVLSPTFRRDGLGAQLMRIDEGEVLVLDRVKVAGYDATILEATDAASLTAWLGDNGYDARPEIADWVAPYVAKKWKVTAFKYSADNAKGGIGTGAIRMTFETDQPLFPYRVPSDQRDGRNTLRVYYVGDERAEGTIGGAASAWQKETRFSNKIAGLEKILDRSVPECGEWLTAFEDSRWPGGAEDLYFAPSKDPTPVIPAPRIEYIYRTAYVPLDVTIVLAAIFAILWYRKRSLAV